MKLHGEKSKLRKKMVQPAAGFYNSHTANYREPLPTGNVSTFKIKKYKLPNYLY